MFQIGVGDSEQRLVSGVWINMPCTGAFITGRRAGNSATPGRNASGVVTGHLAAERRQTAAKQRDVAGQAGVDREQQHQRDPHQVFHEHVGSPYITSLHDQPRAMG
ncbi:NAD(P)-dependent dehydrogenase [Pseudomonas syringae pv. actinidiae]|uniref:NAD(P)-dependent dehydrogenase n=1 Tax=Pseudomonas syringae pv. actinidiae TaxID=103796 RepID=A0A2V0QI64_PSESF|nr:NAD(P)-dependent dehydrogenase [Pseudomonas syringae pv. actinidiae]